MNFQWMGQSGPCPIVEFHDIRSEAGAREQILDRHEQLAPALAAAGAADLGRFRVTGHPERLMVMRGFAGMEQRRQALGEFYAGAVWGSYRYAAAIETRDQAVILTRAVKPADGIRPIRLDTCGWVALISELRFAEQIGNYHLWLRLLLRKAGLDPVAAFATLEAHNDVPAVPVVKHRTQHIAMMRAGRVPELPPELRGMLRFAPEVLQLEPALSLVW